MLEINGEMRRFDTPHTICTLLIELALDPERVVIEHNGTIPERTAWQDICLKPGDRLEIVRFMGGG